MGGIRCRKAYKMKWQEKAICAYRSHPSESFAGIFGTDDVEVVEGHDKPVLDGA